MLVQPQQAATVCELDLVLHTIGSSKRAQTLDPNQRPENSHEPLNLTLDLEYAHVSRNSAASAARTTPSTRLTTCAPVTPRRRSSRPAPSSAAPVRPMTTARANRTRTCASIAPSA